MTMMMIKIFSKEQGKELSSLDSNSVVDVDVKLKNDIN